MWVIVFILCYVLRDYRAFGCKKKDSLFLRETVRGISLWQCVYKVTCELVIVEIVRLGKDGRITIPARSRRSLEIKKGAVFVVECSEQGLVLRPLPRLVDKAR